MLLLPELMVGGMSLALPMAVLPLSFGTCSFTVFPLKDIIMIAFVMIALGRCCSGPVKRRSWLGLGGVMLVVAAGLAAYGFSSGLGEVIG